MRPYAITGIGTAIIVSVVAGMWLGWGIDTVDFTTALAVGLVLIIPCIWWWAYNKEKVAKHNSHFIDKSGEQMLKKLKPKKARIVHPKFSRTEVNSEKINNESKSQREHRWRFFPANYR